MKLLLEGAAGDGTGGGGAAGSAAGGAASGASAPWFAAIKDEGLRADATVAGTPDLDTFVKRAVETKAMVGKKLSDFAPKPDWKPEQRAEWNKIVGVPESADKYHVPDAALLAKSGMTKETLAEFYKHAHSNHIPADSVKATLDWYVGLAAKGAEAQEQQRKLAAEQEIATLKQEYGDKFDAKIGLMKAFLSKFGNDDLTKWADESGAGNNPGLVRALVKAGEAMLESSALGGNRDLGPDANKAAAMKEIDEIMVKRINDKTFAAKFNDPKSEEWKKWMELHSTAYPKAA